MYRNGLIIRSYFPNEFDNKYSVERFHWTYTQYVEGNIPGLSHHAETLLLGKSLKECEDFADSYKWVEPPSRIDLLQLSEHAVGLFKTSRKLMREAVEIQEWITDFKTKAEENK